VEETLIINNHDDLLVLEDTAVIATASGVQVRDIAYTVLDPFFGEFHVQKSANAWWMDRRKVEKLIAGFKSNLPVTAAWVYAEITKGQWQYFNEIHPEFSAIKDACEDVAEGKQMIRFMNTLNEEGVKDLATVRWFLERRHPRFAQKARVPDGTEVLQPQINNVNIATGIQIDTKEIIKALKEAAREVFGTDEGVDELIANGIVSDLSQGHNKVKME